VSSEPVTLDEVWEWLEAVPDPEIPVISVVDLGVVRDVQCEGRNATVTITPTYSGCPAMAVIAQDIESELVKQGVEQVEIVTKIAPAWTTDWLSEKGKAQLEGYGIAPPRQKGVPERCPHCQSTDVTKVSQFGSTPCKAQWRCDSCLEPFDYFKCI